MTTIALQRTTTSQPEAKVRKSRAAQTVTGKLDLTKELEQLLDDVENDRVHSVDPKNYREGFKELLKKMKS